MRECGIHSKYILKGYVIFENSTGLWWLKVLKKGYRHCYIIFEVMDNPSLWVEVNPMSNQVIIQFHHSLLGINYINHIMRKKDIKVIAVDICSAPLKCAPIGVFSCVEFVKRVLGIHDLRIITPYQLYKFLNKKLKIVGKKS